MPVALSRRGLQLHPSQDSLNQRSWSKQQLVRTNTVASNFVKAAGTPISSSRGKRVFRSVVGLWSRSKNEAIKSEAAAITEPASPVSAQLSRTNSASSSHEGAEEGDQASEQRDSPTPRVSFDPEVTTVMIAPMDEEEVRNTFYCRSEYAAFKDAYRTHRDTSRGWCRTNDVLPCNCDACQDDLGQTPPSHLASDDNYDSAFEDPDLLHNSSGDGLAVVSPAAGEEEHERAPPSPAGAVVRGDESTSTRTSRRAGQRGNSRRPSHARHGSWGVARTLPIAKASGSCHRRGGSLDDWEGKSSVQEAVRCHGSEYAYKTLRLQGFSDLYIRTHFLPDESLSAGRRR